MFHLHWYKVGLLYLLMFLSSGLLAQEHNPLYDNKAVRFGFALSGINAKLKFTTKSDFIRNDSLQRVDAINFPGIGLGGLANFRLTENIDLRTMINIQLVQRNLNYNFRGGDKMTAEMESTYFELPILLKYKSKRHNNWRLYCIGGVSYRYDFISDIETDRSNTKPVVALYPNTFSYDLGFGFDFYAAFSKISPEIRLSNALGNHLVPDGYIFAGNLERVSPKLIQFSIIFN